MLKRLAVLIVAASVAGIFIAFGCGSGDDEVVTNFSMKMLSNVGSQNQDIAGILLDASGGTTGTITGPPEAIADTASSSCAFTVTEGTLTGTGDIQLTSNATSLVAAKAECTNVSNCIWCYPVVSGTTCNITCQGAIAVNVYTPSDYFDLTFAATHAFTTEMEADGQGMIRNDGSINFGDGTDDLTYVSQDFIQTSCSDAAAVVVEDEGNTTLTGLTVDGDAYDATSSDGVYHEYYEITTSAASEGVSKSCTVQDEVVVRCTVPAGLIGTTVMDCSSSVDWINSASFCQGQDNCDEYTP